MFSLMTWKNKRIHTLLWNEVSSVNVQFCVSEEWQAHPETKHQSHRTIIPK